MLSNRMISILAGTALLIVAGFTLRQAIASTETASAASAGSAGVLEQVPSSSPYDRPGSSWQRFEPERCLDGMLNRAGLCAGHYAPPAQQAGGSFRSPPDECFDVPLREGCDR